MKLQNYLKCVVIFFSFSFFGGMTLCSISQAAFAKPNDPTRQELIQQYLKEFVSSDIRVDSPKIYHALQNVFAKLPDDVADKITMREFPVVFVSSISSGIAHYAHARTFLRGDDEPQSFQNGFYLIILNDELNNASSIEAVEGIILHEIAHPYLEHFLNPAPGCELEREANRLVKSWGFEGEYLKAKELFGHKTEGDSPCHDEKEEKK